VDERERVARLARHPLSEFRPMSDISSAFDFRKRVAYHKWLKRDFHLAAHRQLRRLAEALGLPPGAYSIRSNAGGMAVSGEITLHADRVYVQVCQPATGQDTGVMFRTCEGRKDYYGGPNNFASLDLLNLPQDLALRIREVCHV
jgi:hypothetical protein